MLSCLERLAIVKEHGTVESRQIHYREDFLKDGIDHWYVTCLVGKTQKAYNFIVDFNGDVIGQRSHNPLNRYDGFKKPQARFIPYLDKFLAGYGARMAHCRKLVSRMI